MKNLIGYVGMSLTFTGVLISTSPAHVKWCFPFLLVAAIAWLINGWLSHNRPQVITQLALLTINIIAVYRWFT